MGSLAANIAKGCDRILRQFALHAEAPLLDIRPNALRGNGGDIQRKRSGCSAALAHASDAFVAGGMVLSHIQYQRCAAFERTGVRFVANPVVEKYSVARTDRGFAITPWIPSETDAGSRIKDMTCHTAIWNVIHAASLEAIGDSRVQIVEIQRDWRTGAGKRTRGITD